jgi:two-component system response regulator YesN
MLYQEARQLLNFKFYLGKGCIITEKDQVIGSSGRILKDLNTEIEEISISVKCGNKKAVSEGIDVFFTNLKNDKLEKEIILTYSIDLVTSIIRNNSEAIKLNTEKGIDIYLKKSIKIQQLNTIDEIVEQIKSIALEIAGINYTTFTCQKNRLVQLIVQKVSENIDNEELSLKWLSSHMVFANVDYLSKIFKKEMGINFSQYVIRERMEMAKNLLYTDNKIYTVARKVGFGDNSQYFSQVFKSYTGLSPSYYRRKHPVA